MSIPPNVSKFGWTYVLIALNAIVYVYTALLSGDFIQIDYDVLAQYGQFNAFVFEGAYWQLFTSMFVHVNIMHLVGNMLFLLIFGLRAEEFFKVEEYLGIYFAGGLVGNLLTLLFGPNMVSAGASGAIFAIYGAVTVYIRRFVGQSIISALMYAFFLLFLSSGFGVNVLAHLGGLIVGLFLGYLLASSRRPVAIYQYRYGYSR
jgi:rhomboid protease GluP